MMSIEVLRFDEVWLNGLPCPVRAEFDLGSCATQRQGLKRPTACVVPNLILDRFGEKPFTDQFERRIKEKAELSRVLLGRRRVPFVRTDYSVRGRFLRSLRDLLVRAANRNERSFYFIGVEQTLFDNLWEYAGRLAEIRNPSAADGTETTEPWQVIFKRLKNQHVNPVLQMKYVGISKRAEFVRHMIMRAASSKANVLILGETGTGKEIIARSIHEQGPRAAGLFEAVNCAGIPETLFESELFGHKEGAFTDARFKKQGKWTLANNGTLFLDEIGDLSMSHQGKILRALEDGEITPVGDTEPTSVDARVIAATNKNLHYMVKQGTFREDLMFRLRTFLIPVPALYLHQEDIPPIANHLWQKITDDPQAVLPDPVLAEIQKRRWPGNAREIKSALECVHAIVGADGIDPDILRAVLDQQDGPERDLFG